MDAADGIDKANGTVDVYKMCPEPGDSIMIVNCGTHFEVRHHHWVNSPFSLTEEDIEDMKSNKIVWN